MIKKLLNFLFGIGRMQMKTCVRIVTDINSVLQEDKTYSLHVSIHPHCFSDSSGFDAVGGVLGINQHAHYVELTIRYKCPTIEVWMRDTVKSFQLNHRVLENTKSDWVAKSIYDDHIKAIAKHIEAEFLKD